MNRTEVYNIFIDFFGEDKVDLQGEDIIVHFPKVTVTNENNKSIDITHLWVKVSVNEEGQMNNIFKMVRSELTESQFVSEYSHSHLPPLNANNITEFNRPCLGNGPIRNTICSLTNSPSEDMWQLFCLELSRYVATESLSGGPYRRLESVKSAGYTYIPLQFPYGRLDITDKALYNIVMHHLIPVILRKKPFDFNYINGSFGIAMSDKDILITLSNIFIEYYNSLTEYTILPPKRVLFENGVIFKGKVIDNNILKSASKNNCMSIDSLTNTHILTFKGNDIQLNIIREEIPSDNNTSILLSPEIAFGIVGKLLRVINYKYGKYSTGATEIYI